jgi:hypothetical protein
MKKDPLDPRVEMMIASLYGELSPEEEERFQKLLDEDPALRAEWQELTGTRAVLSAWTNDDEQIPSFVLLDPQRGGGTARAGRWARWRGSWPRLAVAGGWAVAAAAVALIVLALVNFRFELFEGGFAVRIGPPASGPSTSERIAAPAGSVPAGPEVAGPERAGRDAGPAQLTGSGPGAPGASGRTTEGSYLTRAEFDAYTAGMARAMSDMLQSYRYDQRQNEDFTEFSKAMYDGLTERQQKDYYDLRSRIEALRYGLTEVESNTNDRLRTVLGTGPGEPITPGDPAPAGSGEGQHDR